MRSPGWVMGLAILAFIAAPAIAKDCDCSQKLGNCSANITVEGSGESAKIRVKVLTSQCAQVTFEIDGEPGSITLTDGDEYLPYLPTKSARPKANSTSCSLCKTKN